MVQITRKKYQNHRNINIFSLNIFITSTHCTEYRCMLPTWRTCKWIFSALFNYKSDLPNILSRWISINSTLFSLGEQSFPMVDVQAFRDSVIPQLAFLEIFGRENFGLVSRWTLSPEPQCSVYFSRIIEHWVLISTLIIQKAELIKLWGGSKKPLSSTIHPLQSVPSRTQ